MCYGGPEMDELNELFDPKNAHLFYKDPDAHFAQAIEILEKNTVCKKCGKKDFKVIDFKNSNAVCQNCGHKL